MSFSYDSIIVNGDSYSAPQKNMTAYAFVLAQKYKVPVSNISVVGSSNDRITRSTMEKVLSSLDAGKRPLVIVGWSFVRRMEVWYYGNNFDVLSRIPDKIHLETHKNPKFVSLNILANLNELTLEQKCLINEDLFVHKQLTDFYTNVYLLSQFLQNHNVDYFFFSAAKNTELPINCFPYIENLRHVQQVVNDPNILDLHDFCILNWAADNDPDAHPVTGHLSNTGHLKFAEFLSDKINDIQSHQKTQS